MKRYLIIETTYNTGYIVGNIVLITNSDIDQHALSILGEKVIELDDYVEKVRWNRPADYVGVDPVAERRKWAKYHREKKLKNK